MGSTVAPGWFYRFKIPGSRKEYVVQVVDSVVAGATVAEAVVDVKPLELPIDPLVVKLDSIQVMQQFLQYAKQRGMKTDGIDFDLELISPQGGKGPVWSVVDPTSFEWLYSVSGLDGTEAANPHK